MKIRVYYEDTDAGGIVYHANYFKFCERARSEIVFGSGFGFGADAQFVASKINAEFSGSARLGDLLDVRTKALKIAKASVILEQSVVKIAEFTTACDEKLLFKAQIVLAFLSNGKIAKIDDKFSGIFANLS